MTQGHHPSSSAAMSLGNRRNIPPSIKELMVTLQTRKTTKKSQIATILDGSPRTVRRVTKISEAEGNYGKNVSVWDGGR